MRVQGLGFRVLGFESRVWGVARLGAFRIRAGPRCRSRVQSRVQALPWSLRVWGLGFSWLQRFLFRHSVQRLSWLRV